MVIEPLMAIMITKMAKCEKQNVAHLLLGQNKPTKKISWKLETKNN